MPDIKEITIKDLHDYLEVSNKAFKICIDNKIYTIDDLKTHIRKNGSFKNLRNCGRQTNKELIKLSKWKGLLFVRTEKNDESLTLLDYQFVTKVKSLFENTLGIRSQNALNVYFDGILTKEKIEREFIAQVFPITKLRNVGVKTAVEIEHFILEVITLYQKIEIDPLPLSIEIE
jgi:hypothetical protein